MKFSKKQVTLNSSFSSVQVHMECVRDVMQHFQVTMKRQIQHMIKYKYLPFSYGKKVRRGCM